MRLDYDFNINYDDWGIMTLSKLGRQPATPEIARERQELLGEIPHDDPVSHPAHYTSHPSGVECIQITRHYPFCTGNAIKYLWRAGLKHESGMDDTEKQIQDLRKAVWYINEHIRLLETGEASG